MGNPIEKTVKAYVTGETARSWVLSPCVKKEDFFYISRIYINKLDHHELCEGSVKNITIKVE